MAESTNSNPMIGNIHARGQKLDAHVLIAAENMGQLVSLVSSGRLRVISMVGEPLKRRKGARIQVTTHG